MRCLHTQWRPCLFTGGGGHCKYGCLLLQGRVAPALRGFRAPQCTLSGLGVCGPHSCCCFKAWERQREGDKPSLSCSSYIWEKKRLSGHRRLSHCDIGMRFVLPLDSPPYSDMWVCPWHFLSLRGISASEHTSLTSCTMSRWRKRRIEVSKILRRGRSLGLAHCYMS